MRIAVRLMVLLIPALFGAAMANGSTPAHVAAGTVERFESTLGIARLVDNADVPVVWLGKDGALAFARTENGERRWFLAGAKTGAVERLTLPDGSSPIAVIGGTEAMPHVQTGAGPVMLDRAAGRATPLSPWSSGSFVRPLMLFDQRAAADAANPQGGPAATLVEGNLALRSADGSVRMLTGDAAPMHGWDLEAPGPLGANTSPWSPDGRQVYAARVDRRSGIPVPVLSVTGRMPTVSEFPYWEANKPLPLVRPAIIDAATGRQVAIELGDTSQSHIRLIGWQPDGRGLWIARANRLFNRLDILRADVVTGAVTTVFTEQDETFVRMLHNYIYGGDIGLHLLSDGFLLLSERDGWNHVYRYSSDGRLKGRLTRGAFPVRQILAVNETRGTAIVLASPDKSRPADMAPYSVSLSGGALKALSPGEGEQKVRMAPSGDRFVTRRSTPGTAPVTELRSADGALIATLATADLSRLKARGWTPPEQVFAKVADDRTTAWGVLYKPADFDPAKRYPVLEYIYGGPQVVYAPAGFVAEAFPAANLPQALAELGFVVLVIDTPGTPGRSREFHQFTAPGWGRGIVQDHAAAIRDLGRTRPWMDTGRVGIFGHSWGGYHSFMALALAGDLYKAAVSSGPAYGTDFPSIMDEAYLGDPTAHPERYAAFLPFQYADRIRPDTLLLVSGTADVTIYPSMLRMSDELLKRGIRHEVLPLPDQGHGFSPAGYDYAGRRIADFFVNRLLGQSPIDWQISKPAPSGAAAR
jgi:dipeptidyl-peptidase 4